jgi:transcriptional regulator with XRE-family HTH domain
VNYTKSFFELDVKEENVYKIGSFFNLLGSSSKRRLQMYPHPIDRLRIVRLLLRHSRKRLIRPNGRAGFTEKELAKKLNISQTTLSNLESESHLKQVALGEATPISRKSLVQILTWGLALPQQHVDAILWLYQGEKFKALQDIEVDRYAPYLKPTQSRLYDGNELRCCVLAWLKSVLNALIEGAKTKQGNVEVTVKMVFELDELSDLETDRELFKMETVPGQRLLVSKYPSYLTYPPHVYDSGEWRGFAILSEDGRREEHTITDRRRQNFLNNLSLYGERSIHSIGSLRRYLQKGFKHRFTFTQRKEHIEYWIQLLDQHDYYQVAFAPAEPEIELEIKSTVSACLRGAPGDRHWQKIPNKNQSIVCGPRLVYWYDRASVLAFLLDYEREWEAIAEKWRDKEHIKRWLKQMLDRSS